MFLYVALWLPEVHLIGAPFGSLDKLVTALLVSPELTLSTTKGASEGEEWERTRGERKGVGKGVELFHSVRAGEDLSLGLLIMSDVFLSRSFLSFSCPMTPLFNSLKCHFIYEI